MLLSDHAFSYIGMLGQLAVQRCIAQTTHSTLCQVNADFFSDADFDFVLAHPWTHCTAIKFLLVNPRGESINNIFISTTPNGSITFRLIVNSPYRHTHYREQRAHGDSVIHGRLPPRECGVMPKNKEIRQPTKIYQTDKFISVSFHKLRALTMCSPAK